ncbi:MAG: homoserine kinase [Bacteroidetes bacterium]|nr:homoserine kinase [Bacteroidota bacterium]
MKSVKVFAPATVANLGCGFDVMGLAIDVPGDELMLSFNKDKKLIIKKITGDGGKLSYNAKKNTVTVAIQSMLDEMKMSQGFDVVLKKKMPLGSGLGSSAASSVAGVFAANVLLGKPFSKKELVPFAMAGEKVASGSAHADNVAPCLLGGIILIRSYEPLDIIQLPVPAKLYLVVVHPHVEVLTKDARAVLKKNIPLNTAVRQWGNTAAFTAGLFSNDMDLIGRSVEDHVAEPARAALIPHFHEVKNAALESGAIACSISGSGPSIFALCNGKNASGNISKAMKKVFTKNGIQSEVYISSVNKNGVRII